MSRQEFTDKVTVVTGATGGLGRAMTRGFAERGSRVFLTDRAADDLAGFAQELRDDGFTVCFEEADFRRSAAAAGVIEAAVKAFGRIDVLINNAGVCGSKSLWDLSEEDWDEVLNINVKALFFALQSAARHMRERGGAIVNVASVAGRVGRPTLLHYAASKAAVISITRSAAAALAAEKVRVNAIAPGMIDTGMLHDLQATWARDGSGGVPSPAKVPLGRIAQPEEIVRAALFLASDDAEYITGQTLNVCGGIVMS